MSLIQLLILKYVRYSKKTVLTVYRYMEREFELGCGRLETCLQFCLNQHILFLFYWVTIRPEDFQIFTDTDQAHWMDYAKKQSASSNYLTSSDMI